MKFIMMVGLQGSGKSTLAKKIAEKEDAVILSSDAIRTELYGTLMDQSDHERVFNLTLFSKKSPTSTNLFVSGGMNCVPL